jgi:hypothetical protein
MEEISRSVVLPVTDAQMTAFSAWVINTYVTYEGVMGAIKSPEIDTYIKTHILPEEMTNVLRVSEPFRGEKWGDVNIQWMLLNRRRVTAKINNLKGKIVTRTFPIEVAQKRRDLRAAEISRRQAREEAEILQRQAEEAAYMSHSQIYAEYFEAIRFKQEKKRELEIGCVKIQLSEEDAKTLVMDDDCVICLQMHKMTEACTINCGHQFGRLCLAKWKKDTCPLCRTNITKTTVFMDTYFKEQETLAAIALVVVA